MGGEVFDDKLGQHAKNQLLSHIDLSQEPSEVQYVIKSKVRQTKEMLSQQDQRSLALSSSKGACPKINVTRAEFESLIQPDIQKAVTLTQDLLNKVSGQSFRPEIILLVGGTSLIPAIADTLKKISNLPCHPWQYSREAVALGAALLGNSKDLIIESQQPIMHLPSEQAVAEAPLYRVGLDYLFGINGKEKDAIKAAQIFQKGYEQDDINCSYFLAMLYSSGEGVPWMPEVAFNIGNELIEQNCPLGFCLLAEAYATGEGAPLDKTKSEFYKQQLAEFDSALMPNVPEIIRLYALISCYLQDIDMYIDKLECLSSQNLLISDLPIRFGFAVFLMMSHLENLNSYDELRNLLHLGCKSGDALSKFATGLLLLGSDEECPVFKRDNDLCFKLLDESCLELSFATCLRMNLEEENEQTFNDLQSYFWNQCNFGVSRIPSDYDLGCLISISPADFQYGFRVYEQSVLYSLINANSTSELLLNFQPKLRLTNTSSNVIVSPLIRICLKDIWIEKKIKLNQNIPPNNYIEIDPADYDIWMESDLYVEVFSGNLCSRMRLDCLTGLNQFRDSNGMPIMVCWEKGFFGGYILKIRSLSGTLSNVNIYKSNKAHCDNSFTLYENTEYTAIGWAEFSDGVSLTANEIFFITCDGYAPVIAQILTTQADQGDAGWKSAAKIAGGGLLAALGIFGA